MKVDFNTMNFVDALKHRDELKEQLKEAKGYDINPRCDNDCYFAYMSLVNKRYEFKDANTSIHDYSTGKTYTKANIMDRDVEDLIKRVPEYAQYFTIKDIEDGEKPKQANRGKRASVKKG